MTFQELDELLINGFHDALLENVTMNYVDRRLCLDLYFCLGEVEPHERREVYRPARVTFENVAYLVIEPPDVSRPWSRSGRIRIDAGSGTPSQSQSIVPSAPVGTSAAWVYLNELNRFLLFASASASLEWTGPEENWA